MNRIRIILAAGVLLIAACGVTGPSSTASPKSATPAGATLAARRLLLSAVSKTAAEPVRVDATLSGTVTGSGSLAALGSENFAVTMHLDVASPANVSENVTMSLDGFALRTTVVSVAGTEYSSSDGGQSWKAVPGGGAPGTLTAPLEYLQSAADVADSGTKSVDGRPAHQYLVTLDPQLLTQFVRNMALSVSAGNPAVARILDEVVISDAQVNADVGPGGDLVKASGHIDASVDATAIETGAAGGQMTIHGTVVSQFTDSGGAITVTPPPHT